MSYMRNCPTRTRTGRRSTKTGSSSAMTRCCGSASASASSTTSCSRRSSSARRCARERASPDPAGLFFGHTAALFGFERIPQLPLDLLVRIERLRHAGARWFIPLQFDLDLVQIKHLLLLECAGDDVWKGNDQAHHDQLNHYERYRAPIDLS